LRVGKFAVDGGNASNAISFGQSKSKLSLVDAFCVDIGHSGQVGVVEANAAIDRHENEH
jgi:hypothetical protein